MIKRCCEMPARQYFLAGARLGFGLWLAYVGVTKWTAGPDKFVGAIGEMFGPTWSPAGLNTALAWLILCAEPLIGIWLLSGNKQRCAWTAAAVLMFLLAFGMTMLQKPEVIGNMQYFVFCLFCAAWSDDCRAKNGV